MAFNPPTFNLTCNVWHGTSLHPGVLPADITGLACALQHAKKNAYDMSLAELEGLPLWTMLTYLLVPAGSDIRDQSTATGSDVIECPAGSGRFYMTTNVDDVAKGYPNEYRIAPLLKWTVIMWPTPIP